MKRLLKWSGGIVLLLLLLASALLLHTIYAKPLKIGWFFERVFLEFALDDPEMLSRIRVLEPIGIRGHNSRLTDASPEREQALREKLNADYAMLKRYDRDKLDPETQLSYDILDYFLGLQVRGEAFAHYNFPVNQMFGVQSSLPNFFADVHQVRSKRDAEDYLTRMTQVDTKFQQVLEGLKLREEKGILPPRFTVEKVLEQMRGFRGTPVRENVMVKTFIDKLGKSTDISAADKTSFETEAIQAMEAHVLPGYDRLISYYENLLTKVTSNDGVWRLPDGDKFYAHAIEMHTTAPMDADKLHWTGVEEVARIHGEMDQILRDAGYVDGTVGERMARLGKDPAQLYPDSAEGKEMILADFRRVIEEINHGLEPYFDVRPRASVEVRPVPAFSEKTAPGAYYQGPAMDGSRPGVFYLNLRKTEEITRFGVRTLAYHEAIPGHHFQVAIMQELKGVPTFRRLLPFTAYSEGWALYTELLAWEAGFQDNPLDNLGRLQAELFRAVRLVVDTGMHAKRWSREQAIEYMLGATGMSETDVVAEIERYLVNPGQALAYKVGMMKIVELRDRAREKLGERFDVREFHNVVLTGGAMPLAILERRVDAWIAAKGA